jgi:hypothetical protein
MAGSKSTKLRGKVTLPILLLCLITGIAAIPPSTHANSESGAGPQAVNASVDSSDPNKDIIRGIDSAVQARENTVAGYTVQDHYAIFRNGDTKPSAEMTVQTVYKRGSGKEFTTLSQSGSGLLRSTVIEKILASEKEMSGPSVRNSVLVNSSNYEFAPEPGKVDYANRQCIVVDLKARRKSQHLFNGKAWVDASDFSVVRLEGTPAQSVSFFAGESAVDREYQKIDGVPMAVHAEAHSHSFLLGTTVLKIDSTNYQIQHNP